MVRAVHARPPGTRRANANRSGHTRGPAGGSPRRHPSTGGGGPPEAPRPDGPGAGLPVRRGGRRSPVSSRAISRAHARTLVPSTGTSSATGSASGSGTGVPNSAQPRAPMERATSATLQSPMPAGPAPPAAPPPDRAGAEEPHGTRLQDRAVANQEPAAVRSAAREENAAAQDHRVVRGHIRDFAGGAAVNLQAGVREPRAIDSAIPAVDPERLAKATSTRGRSRRSPDGVSRIVGHLIGTREGRRAPDAGSGPCRDPCVSARANRSLRAASVTGRGAHPSGSAARRSASPAPRQGTTVTPPPPGPAGSRRSHRSTIRACSDVARPAPPHRPLRSPSRCWPPSWPSRSCRCRRPPAPPRGRSRRPPSSRPPPRRSSRAPSTAPASRSGPSTTWTRAWPWRPAASVAA